MLINVKMPTIVAILTLMSWISFMLSWVEYEKSCITSGSSPVWTFIEDVCAYIYDEKAYKNLVCIMSLFAHFPIVSYQPRTPLGQSINEYTAHLGKLNWSVFAFMCGSRGGEGGPNLLGLKMKSCFLTDGPGPPR